MLILSKSINLIILLPWILTVCDSQNKAIQHLNLKFNRLNRITNGLQKDVEDIWLALSNTAVTPTVPGNVDQDTNNTVQTDTHSEEVLELVNGTVSDVKELKAEVEELILYAQNGLKNEKAFVRGILRDIQIGLNDHEANTKNNIAEMKTWKQNFELTQRQTIEDMFQTFTTKSANDDHILLVNVTSNFKANLAENAASVKDRFETVKQNFTSIEKFVTNAVSLAKHEILEILRERLGACGEDWDSFDDSCYLLSSVEMGWDDAWDYCGSIGGYLLEIDSSEEINFVLQKYITHAYLWVGGNDKEKEGTFLWQNSKKAIPADYFFPGEPNDQHGEDCAQFYCQTVRVGKLNDTDCTRKLRFICEKSKYIF